MPPKKAPTKPAAGRAPAARGPVRPTATVAAASKKPAAPKTTGGTKKAPSAAKPKPAGGAAAKLEKPATKKWTAEDEAAKKIQTLVRKFLAKRRMEKKKKEKEEYESTMEKLEKEAFATLVRMEQEQAEKIRQKEEEEKRRLKEARKRRKRMLDAAFDGDVDEIHTVLKEVKDLDNKNNIGHDVIGTALRNRHELEMVDCADANDNTPLSEAAGGGHPDVIKLLIERGADPNSQGRFKRTPLYRAAFAGHLEPCQTLLQYGSDPRIYAEDGQTPEQVATQTAVKELFADWDISQTERLLAKLENDKEKRKEENRKRQEAEMNKLEEQAKEAEKDYKSMQSTILKLTEELNKRIEEHDMAMATGFERTDVTLQCVHDAETDLEIGKIDLEKARDKVSALKLQLREQQKESDSAGVSDLPGLKVTIRELEDVLIRDVGNRIKDSGQWPLIIDTSGQASIFLRYRDTNYIDALSPKNMEEQKLRLATLGAIRYGKPLVLDMMEVDMFDTCAMMFDRILPGLMDSIMDKTIIEEQKYLKLIRDSDGPEYNKNNFNDLRLKNFKFVIMMKSPFPPSSLLDKTYPIRIHIPI